MKLSNKHANPQVVSFSDFSGGLNTADVAEMIAQNELAQCQNVEIYKGQLKTVAGTTAIVTDSEKSFVHLIYDRIGETFLMTDSARVVYAIREGQIVQVGTLTGLKTVDYAAWEDGVLITSGGNMQYYHEGVLETLENSPEVCNGVFIRDGRVWTFYDDELHTSAVGDETSWDNDSNDSSTGQWVQIGYKDGGNIVGVASLSADVLIFKDNMHAYHLSGQFPDWTVSEIGRTIDCKCLNGCVSLSNSVVALGMTMVQTVVTTDTYGDMRSQCISSKVYQNVGNLPSSVKVRYLPSLNQVWFLTDLKKFLFLDANNGGFFQRSYNNAVLDAVEAKNTIYLLKANGLYKLDSSTVYDDGAALTWKMQAKTIVSNNAYLLKRIWIDTTPMFDVWANEKFQIGDVVLACTQPVAHGYIYHDYTRLYRSKRPIYNKIKKRLYDNSERVYDSPEYIYLSELPLRSIQMYRAHTRCVNRKQAIRTYGRGYGNSTIFNSISFEIAEV